MTAARQDLTGDLRLEQGADFGPHIFTFRHLDLQDRSIVTILTATTGETYSIEVFGVLSDEPERRATVSYVALVTDTPDEIAAGLLAALSALAVDIFDCETGLPTSTLMSTFLYFAASGPVITLIDRTCGEWPEISATATTPANISIAQSVDTRVDLTSTTLSSTLVKSKSDQTALVTWTTPNEWTILSPAVNGRAQLRILAVDTVTWIFESGWWETLVIDTSGSPTVTKRRLEGDFVNSLSVVV